LKRVVLGVDGGNTKTHYALFDEEGGLLAFLARGTASHEALPGGFAAMEAELRTSLGLLLGPLGLGPHEVAAAVLGLAGADTEAQHDTIGRHLAHLGLPRARLINDAFLGIKAGTTAGTGVCSINGTGTVAAAVGPTGNQVQVGGFGYVSGDEGGGGFLAERVIRAVYDAHFRGGPATKLTGALLHDQRVADAPTLFQHWLAGRVSGLTACKAAFDAARSGDAVAAEILDAMGKNAAQTALGAIALAGFDDGPLEVVLAGSLYIKAESDRLVGAFQTAVTGALGDRARFHLLREPPVAGAVLWALEDLAGRPSPEVRARVLASCLRLT
jgi:N-acetylglucosamine kinase-like BadF-type ATPase